MKIAGRALRFRPVLTLCAALAMGVLVALGAWQLHRLEWKRELIAQVEARVNAAPVPFVDAVRLAEAGEAMEYAPVTLDGQLRSDKNARVFGTFEGAVGAYEFVPIETESGARIYVNLGFTPQAHLNNIETASKTETITGLFRYPEKPAPPASWFQSVKKSVDGLWFVRDPVAFAREAGIDAPAYYIDRFAVEGRDWPKGGTTRLDFNNRHLEYALTWFGLAATLAGVWLAFSLQKP
jgi:surfeit locus 1 family protein